MKKIIKSPVIRYLVLTLAAVVLGINVYTFNATRLAGDALPMPFGYGASVVLSGSMEPELSVGDLLIVQAQESYQVNDVVVFQTGRTPVVHRIIAMDEETVTTQGDANNTPDEPIFKTNLKGEVILVIPMVGHLINQIKTPVGTIVLLALALLFLEGSFKKEKEDDQEAIDALRKEIDRLKNEQNN